MAKILFISLYDRNAYGQRMMSANLKRHGHHCDMLFLKRYDNRQDISLNVVAEDEYPWMGINREGRVFKFASNSPISDYELELMQELVGRLKPDLIGMTVNTPLRSQCIRATNHLKAHFDIPIIWGGYDPTVNPEVCLNLVDYICVGEGDQSILDVADCIDKGVSFDSVPNIGFMRDGQATMNPKHKAEQNLDNYPWRDNDCAGKYFIEDNRLEENHPVLNDKEGGGYQTLSARGCPYKCLYCCEATLKDVYSGEKFLRRRSPKDTVAELADAKSRFNLKYIQFEDEIFAMDTKWLQEFVPLYKAQVDLPFIAYIYPTRNSEQILDLVHEAGLRYCCLALESGSERMNKDVFQRVYNRELFLNAARLLKERGIRFYTDVITYSPYEEEEDLQKTLDVLVEITEVTGAGYEIAINKLFVLPGTKMFQKMRDDNMVIGPSEKDTMFSYYVRLFHIATLAGNVRPLVDHIKTMKLFRKSPWLLNPARVEQWLHTHTPADAPTQLDIADLIPPDPQVWEVRKAEFMQDHPKGQWQRASELMACR